MKKLRYIYEIKNLINNKNYIGKRTCPKNCIPETDRYFGSGSFLRGHYTKVNGIYVWIKGGGVFDKYGKNNFIKNIVVSGMFTVKEIDEYEKYYISLNKLSGKAEYNITLGGTGYKASQAFKGAKWYNDGKIELLSKQPIEGFNSGRIEKTKKPKTKGKYNWFTNGVIDLISDICPENFVRGKTNNRPPSQLGKKWFEKDGKYGIFYEGQQPEGWIKSRRNTFPSLKGFHQYTNGISTKLCEEGQQPEGWYIGNPHIKNTHYFNNGIIDKMCVDGEQPDGFVRGRLYKTNSGKKWYTNGVKNGLYREGEQPNGFKPGTLSRGRKNEFQQ